VIVAEGNMEKSFSDGLPGSLVVPLPGLYKGVVKALIPEMQQASFGLSDGTVSAGGIMV